MGCKNECVFCNQRRISGRINPPTMNSVDKLIEKSLDYFKDNSKKIQIAFFGGSFTGLKISEQISYLEVAYKYVKVGKVESIRVSTRPDYITPRILKILKKYGVQNIELGVQSMDEDVLLASKRGHSKLDVMRAAKLIKIYGFKLGFQIMVGLPKSTAEKELNTVKTLIRLKPDEYRIYPVYVIEPTELYDMYVKKEYLPLEFDDAIDRTYILLKEINKTNAKVIRVGLQSTDEITQNSKKIVGPVCDNFAEYAIARLLLDKLDEKIKVVKEENLNLDKIVIQINKETPLSMVIGPKRCNLKLLEEKYKIKINVESVDK
jgi:histone acetyltransferase (RNA polymerase elongator complex component)